MARCLLALLVFFGISSTASALTVLDGTQPGVETNIGAFIVSLGGDSSSAEFEIAANDLPPSSEVILKAAASQELGDVELILSTVGGLAPAFGNDQQAAELTLPASAFAAGQTVDLMVEATLSQNAGFSGVVEVTGIVTPLPAALGLFAAGMAGLGVLRARRHRHTA